jgi:hypothetical protein
MINNGKVLLSLLYYLSSSVSTTVLSSLRALKNIVTACPDIHISLFKSGVLTSIISTKTLVGGRELRNCAPIVIEFCQLLTLLTVSDADKCNGDTQKMIGFGVEFATVGGVVFINEVGCNQLHIYY